jgi:hypothetical protein
MLLYSGIEVGPPSLGSQVEGSYIPKSNIEEAILLLLILLRKISPKKKILGSHNNGPPYLCIVNVRTTWNIS